MPAEPQAETPRLEILLLEPHVVADVRTSEEVSIHRKTRGTTRIPIGRQGHVDLGPGRLNGGFRAPHLIGK